jgi:glucose-1-phosphate thymidylyltransferase
MEIAKALILAGRGCGDRPWPTAPAAPKHLFPVANRPILFHNLEALGNAGVLEATILVDSVGHMAIRDAIGDGSDWGMAIRYGEWDATHGLGAALGDHGDFMRGEPVLVQQGDALWRERMHPHIAAFAREELDALALRLALPPANPASAPAPGYLLSANAVNMLTRHPETASNPVAGLRALGGRVRVQSVDACLACHGDQDQLLETNRRMLEGIEHDVDPAALEDTVIHGTVAVHRTARVRRSLLRGPLIIGPDARVDDAYIGPYTSIGAGAAIEGSEIEHSIVLGDAVLRFVGTRLESSVIGRGARVVRGFRVPGAIQLSLGDGAEVVLR